MFYIEDNIMYLTKGDDGTLEATSITDANGNEYEMQPGDILTLTVCETPMEDSALIFKTSSQPGSNRLIIRSSDTENANVGRYSADVQLTTADGMRFTVWTKNDGSSRYRTSNLKNFVIMPEVTRP